MTAIKGAIFDMDGLLLDTERLYWESWGEAAKRFGQKPDPAFSPAISGTSGQEMLDTIHKYYPAVDPQAFQAGCMEHLNRLLEERGAPVKAGAREILAFFRERGVKLAVASSSAPAIIEKNLRRAGLLSAFDELVSGQDVARGKPDPDVFLLAAERIGCPPEACYVFEDSIKGVRAGIAAGCVTVMVPDLVQPPEGLTPRAVCVSLTEAMEQIQAGRL